MQAIIQKQSTVALAFVFAALFTVAVLGVYTINTFDYGVFHDATEAVLDGKSPYSINDYYENETEEGTGYYNPPHTIFYVGPFALWGASVLAFFNITIIVALLVGFERSILSTMLISLGILLSPQVIFLAAAVNIPGLTTGLGLLLLIIRPRGIWRGFGWALLAGRPQDAGLVLVYDAWRAFRERDWVAFCSGIAFALPTFILFGSWLSNLPSRSPTGETLSPSVDIGLVPTLIFLLLIVGIRAIQIEDNRTLTRRGLSNVGITERFWILLVITQLLQPYLVFYMLWSHLLMMRVTDARRVGVILAVNLVAFIAFGRGYSEIETTYVVMFVIFLIALIAPRMAGEGQSSPIDPSD